MARRQNCLQRLQLATHQGVTTKLHDSPMTVQGYKQLQSQAILLELEHCSQWERETSSQWFCLTLGQWSNGKASCGREQGTCKALVACPWKLQLVSAGWSVCSHRSKPGEGAKVHPLSQ